jgi:hypothetical protein
VDALAGLEAAGAAADDRVICKIADASGSD